MKNKYKNKKLIIDRWKKIVDNVVREGNGLEYFELSKKIVLSNGVICDLCSHIIGKVVNLDEVKNIAHVVSPEKFSKAVENGLIPPKDSLANDTAYEMWRYISLSSETSWVLCDKCHDKFEKILMKTI